MNKLNSFIRDMAVLALAVGLGLLGGYLVLEINTHYIPHGEWRLVNLGQEKAERLLGSTQAVGEEIRYYVQTDQGNVYRCVVAKCEPAPPEEKAPAEFAQKCGTPSRYAIPRPPGVVKDSFVQDLCGLCGGQISSIILSDGSLWNWTGVTCCEFGCLVNLAYPGCGSGIGLLVGLVLLTLWNSKHMREDTTVRGEEAATESEGVATGSEDAVTERAVQPDESGWDAG